MHSDCRGPTKLSEYAVTTSMTTTHVRTGRVARVMGVVVDAQFAVGDLPSMNSSLLVPRPEPPDLVLEVQEHIDPQTVRCVAMSSTSGLWRGMKVVDSGGPIEVPVGTTTLGRLFNVLGDPIDGGPPLPANALRAPREPTVWSPFRSTCSTAASDSARCAGCGLTMSCAVCCALTAAPLRARRPSTS